MPSCLGLYIEEKAIKYAKLQKDKDTIKVESYNTEFYDDDLATALNRIISETASYKIPVSVNLSEELYANFEEFALLKKKDKQKAIELDYEMFCSENGHNKNVMDYRYLIAEEKENAEKDKILLVVASKSELQQKNKLFNDNKVAVIAPISTNIANIVDIKERENYVVINLEDKTTITTIIDGGVYDVQIVDEGMGEILNSISRVENSISKAYEVCKNITLYTQTSDGLYEGDNSYVDVVSKVLMSVAARVNEIIGESFSNITKIYITGAGTALNNIDLYMQELIPSTKCELLKPYFVDSGSQLPIKEYMEVNSAISLALSGLGIGSKEMNFSSNTGLNKEIDLGSLFNFKSKSSSNSSGISGDAIKNKMAGIGNAFKQDFKAPLKSTDKLILRGMAACIMIIIVYLIFSGVVSKQIDSKKNQIAEETASTKAELDKVDSDVSIISARANVYNQLIEELTAEPEEPEVVENNDSESGDAEKTVIITKDSIPNLLNRIMFVIPKRVKLVSIQNTTSNHIVIKAEAEKYEQLGYFKAVLTTNQILTNVKSTSGEKNGSVVEVTIEGDLP